MHNSIFFFVIFFSVVLYLITWESQDINEHNRSLESCIKYSTFGATNVQILSSSYTFDVDLARSDSTCINPYFPTIKITALNNDIHDAWLHIVHSDTNAEKWRVFIDADQNNYPFYSLNKKFLDSPLWLYGLISKPLSYWEGHAYSVHLKDGKIEFLGGVKWGFKLSFFNLRPVMIAPAPLTKKDFEDDIKSVGLPTNF